MSWHSFSRGMTNVTNKNVLQRISSGEPVVVSCSFSILPMCMWSILNSKRPIVSLQHKKRASLFAYPCFLVRFWINEYDVRGGYVKCANRGILHIISINHPHIVHLVIAKIELEKNLEWNLTIHTLLLNKALESREKEQQSGFYTHFESQLNSTIRHY